MVGSVIVRSEATTAAAKRGWLRGVRKDWACRRTAAEESGEEKKCSPHKGRNPLISPESDEGIQNNPRKSKDFFLGLACRRLVWRGLTARLQDNPRPYAPTRSQRLKSSLP